MSVEVKAPQETSMELQDKTPISLAAWLMVVYVWYFITTPDMRFELLVNIHFERILVVLLVLALFTGQRIPRQLSHTTVLLLIFYFWTLLSYFLSPYQNVTPAAWWIENYWKLLVFYFFMVYSVRSFGDLFTVIAGVCVVSFLYQLHSWYDFVNGGSYVYQQGLKRMVGVWSGGGIGAANGYGMLGLFSIPFGICWLNVSRHKGIKTGLVLYLGICLASIVFSGARAAFLGALVLLVLTFWRSIFRVKVIVPLVAAFAIGSTLLPEDLKHRYFDLIVTSDEQVDSESRSDRVAVHSAESRIQGLIDGWALAERRPIIGYGPGSSGFARREVNTTDSWVNDEDGYLELHNLYGQAMAETGFVGALIFLSLVLGSLFQLRRTRRTFNSGDSSSALMISCHDLIQTSIMLLIFYGMFTHSLYRYYWLLLFAFQVAFVQLARNLYSAPDMALARVNAKLTS